MTSVGNHLNETITIMRLVKIQVWPFGDSTQGINFRTAPVALFCLLQITPRGDAGLLVKCPNIVPHVGILIEMLFVAFEGVVVNRIKTIERWK